MARVMTTTVFKKTVYIRCQFGAECNTSVALARNLFVSQVTKLSFSLFGGYGMTEIAPKGIGLPSKFL
jgi:hypothetical protein